MFIGVIKPPLAQIVQLVPLLLCVQFSAIILGCSEVEALLFKKKAVLASCLDWFQLGMWAAFRKESTNDAYGCSKETCPSPISLAIQMNSWGQSLHFTLSSGLCHFAGDMEEGYISLTRWTKRPWGICTSEKLWDPAGESVCQSCYYLLDK